MAVVARLPVFFVGLILLFAAERYLGNESYYLWVKIAAFAVMALGTGLTFVAWTQAKSRGLVEEAKSWILGGAWQLTVLVSCAFYLLYVKVLDTKAGPETFTQKALLAVWLLLFVIGLAAGIGAEWSIRESGRGELAEHDRVRRATLSWLAAGMLLAFLTCLNFAGAQRDKSFDWSYLKVTSPSEATVKMVGTLAEPMKVSVFYPQGNEVQPFVEEYFKALGAAEPRVQVSFFDKDLDPTLAEQYKISRNGQVVFDLSGKQERLDIGLKLTQARAMLRKLDREFQKSFLVLTQQRKTAYFTRGHGEMSWLTAEDKADPLRTIRGLEGFLRDQNYALRFFGVAEGSAKEIPSDASVVFIVGASQPFMPEETEALKNYLDKGGKLFVLLDIEQGDSAAGLAAPQDQANDPLLKMLEGVGLKYNKAPLGNEKNFVSATHSPVDTWFLYSNVFTSHESMTTLARNEEHVAVVFFKSGWFTVTPEIGGWKSFETVRTLSDTFNDENRNFKFDKDAREQRNSYGIGVASQRPIDASKAQDKSQAPASKEVNMARIVAFADATSISDALMRNPANVAYVSDALKWLAGDSKLAGDLVSEEDIKIQHTRKEDVVWFHGTVIVVPLLVIGAGAIATRRGRPKGRPVRKNGQNEKDGKNDEAHLS